MCLGGSWGEAGQILRRWTEGGVQKRLAMDSEDLAPELTLCFHPPHWTHESCLTSLGSVGSAGVSAMSHPQPSSPGCCSDLLPPSAGARIAWHWAGTQCAEVECWQPSWFLPKGPKLPRASHGTAEKSQSLVVERGPRARVPGRFGATAGSVTLVRPKVLGRGGPDMCVSLSPGTPAVLGGQGQLLGTSVLELGSLHERELDMPSSLQLLVPQFPHL